MFKRGKSKSSKQTSSFSRSPIFLRSSAKPKPVVEYCQCASNDIEKGYQPEEKGSPIPVSHSPSASISSETPQDNLNFPETTVAKAQEDPNPLLEELKKLTITFDSSTEKHETQLTKLLQNQQAIAAETGNGGNAKIEPFTGHKTQDIGTWLAKFAYFSEFNNWSAKRKANALPLYLGGSAQIYYNNLEEVTKK